MALLDVDEALARILALTKRLSSQRVSLGQAGGRVLAQDVVAKLTQPPFAASAMDGYAVCVGEGGCQAGQQFRLMGEVAAGQLFGGEVGEGEALRIFTGAPLPLGADTVVIQEDICLTGGGGIEVTRTTDRGKNIRPAGGDFVKGEHVLTVGLALTPARLALVAAAGYAVLDVFSRPRVGILSTGDELVAVGQQPQAGQIIASNAQALSEIVRLNGGEVIDLGLVGDEREALAQAIDTARAAEVDILVTSGGASVGDYDLVQEVLQQADMQLDFWKIAMRPGKPLIFGSLPCAKGRNALVLGLPGNPVSSIVTAHLFLVAMLEKMQGRALSFALKPARLKAPLASNGSRRHYLRARMERKHDGEIWVEPAVSADSSLLSILAHSDCLIVMAENAPAQESGSICQIFIPPYGL